MSKNNISVVFGALLFFCITETLTIWESVNNADIAWYRREVTFSDWRNIGTVDYATWANIAEYYSGKRTRVIGESDLLDWEADWDYLQKQIGRGDTVILGVDRRGNWKGCKEYLIKIMPDLYQGENYQIFLNYTYIQEKVLRIKLWKTGWLAY